MGDTSDKPVKSKEEFSNCDSSSKGSSGIRDEGKKPKKFKFLFDKYKDSRASSNDIVALISAAEKRIKEFFEVLTKRVSDFLDNDLQQLREVSKEELTKINSSLLDYKIQLEKISQEKMKRVAEIKTKLQMRITTDEEVQSFVKYFDDKMREVMKITQNVIDTMRKNKVADTFISDLQTIVVDYGKRVTKAMDGVLDALKDAAGDLRKSMIDKKTIMTKIPKMPTTSELQRMPLILSNAFKRMRGSSLASNDSGKSQDTPLMPATLRGKLSTLNLSKHFNSETIYGRANVAKATYVGVLLYFLYWKFKKSRSS